MAEMISTKVSCLCGTFHTSISIPRVSVPLTGVLCHCNTCRHVSGVLCTSYACLPSAPHSLNGLSKYEGSDECTRFFCGSCGAHVFAHLKSKDLWLLATGVLEGGADLVTFKANTWVGETRDGGMSAWLPHLYGEEMVRYSRGSQNGDLFQPQRTSKPMAKPEKQGAKSKLHASCHCGGVHFHITPPSSSSKDAASPWPDLLAPYHSTSSANPRDVKWWLRANNTQYLAGLCTCRSCRLASGFDIQAWTFVPGVNVVLDTNGKALDLSTAMGTLRRYESSKSTYREFCATCGATVFWHCDERPDLVDVSVGLLEAESGARAEEWLEWCTERVSFIEDARDTVLVGALVEGLRAWGEEASS